MIVSILPIARLQFDRVNYYTVKIEGRTSSEFADFQRRMSNERDGRELAELNRYIERIGDRYGAYPNHFKDEDAAERLPPPYHKFIETDEPDNYGIRLYCIRLTPSIVILLNGDRKTALKVKDCSNCYRHFDLARTLSKKITEAINDGDIELNEETKEIEIAEDFELTI